VQQLQKEFKMIKIEKFTEYQKLQAISLKYYSNYKWEPRLYDYYTLTRHSFGLELFQIVEESGDRFGITKIWGDDPNFLEWNQPSYFDKKTFTEGFGEARVHLHDFIILPG
jgi:hypothetical protein